VLPGRRQKPGQSTKLPRVVSRIAARGRRAPSPGVNVGAVRLGWPIVARLGSS